MRFWTWLVRVLSLLVLVAPVLAAVAVCQLGFLWAAFGLLYGAGAAAVVFLLARATRRVRFRVRRPALRMLVPRR